MKNMITEILEHKEPGNLALIIVDKQTNNPVKEALVTVFDESGNNIVTAGTTNEQGLIGFQKLTLERYKVRVNAVGYELVDSNVTVESGKLNIEDVKLQSECKVLGGFGNELIPNQIINLEVY
jgi:hypothetical protein